MINNFNTKNRKDDFKVLAWLIAGFLFVVWLCTPPGNKFAQMCFYGNHTQFFIAKLTKPNMDLKEYIFHRNNAVYLARMERKSASLIEMDKAIMTFPSCKSDNELLQLYSERGQLRLYWGEYKAALDDYLRLKNPGMLEKFQIALLYKKVGNNKYALSYCNSILNMDPHAYVGYACIADVYAGVGRYDVSVKVFDILIDRVPNRAQYYVDRALYKKQCGDIDGYNEDISKAKELSPMIREESSIIEDTLKPKKLALTIM